MTQNSDSPQRPALRRGEVLLHEERESRVLRALADGFVCVVSMGVGVAFHTLVMGGSDAGLPVLATIALTLAPIFLFMSTRPLSHVFLTDQRLFVGYGTREASGAEIHQIETTRRWLATLFVKLRDGSSLSVSNMRGLYAIEAQITRRRPQ